MNQFCLRVSRYYKLWKAEDNNNKKKKKKNSCYGQTTQHCYKKLKILSKLIVSLHIHTFPWKMGNQGVSLVSLLISGIRRPISVLKSGPYPERCSKAQVVSMVQCACWCHVWCGVRGCTVLLVPCPWVQGVPAGAVPSHRHSSWTPLCQASLLPRLFWNPCLNSWSRLPPLQGVSKWWHADLLR